MAAPEAQDLVGPCPSDEDVAAFIDGMLRDQERERLIAHLAACKACYEVLAGVMTFEDEIAGPGTVGRVVRFPVAKVAKRAEQEKEEETRRRRWPVLRWAAAAAAVLALGIAYEGYRTVSAPPPTARSLITLAGLTEPLLSRPEAAKYLYPAPVFRSVPARRDPEDIARDRPSFMAGVFLVDLRLALLGKNPQATIADLLDQIHTRIEEAGKAKALADSYRQDVQRAKDSAAFVGQIEHEIPNREAELDKFLDPEALAFGKWAEACRLAAITRTPELFTKRSNRRFLSHSLDLKDKELKRRTPASDGQLDLSAERESEVVNILQRIAAEWEAGDPPQSYQTIAEDFGKLIRLYDR